MLKVTVKLSAVIFNGMHHTNPRVSMKVKGNKVNKVVPFKRADWWNITG